MTEKIKELFLLISDFFAYIFSVVKTDREKRIRIIVVTAAVIAVILLAWLFSRWTPPSKRELDPESQGVIHLTITPTPTPTPYPVQNLDATMSSAGNITMINEYLVQKNALGGGTAENSPANPEESGESEEE